MTCVDLPGSRPLLGRVLACACMCLRLTLDSETAKSVQTEAVSIDHS